MDDAVRCFGSNTGLLFLLLRRAGEKKQVACQIKGAYQKAGITQRVKQYIEISQHEKTAGCPALTPSAKGQEIEPEGSEQQPGNVKHIGMGIPKGPAHHKSKGALVMYIPMILQKTGLGQCHHGKEANRQKSGTDPENAFGGDILAAQCHGGAKYNASFAGP